MKKIQLGKKATLDQKLIKLVNKADSIVEVFTGMVNDLRKTNEELNLVALQSQEIAIQHMDMANNAKAKVLTNEQTIKKIENIIG